MSRRRQCFNTAAASDPGSCVRGTKAMPYKDPDKARANSRENSRRYRATAKYRSARQRRMADPENRAKIRNTGKKWLTKPGNLAKAADRQRKHRSRQPKRNEWLYRRHAKYSTAGRPCPDACEICGRTGLKIVFDHCHKHGHFRGWICRRCNSVLGMVRDDPRLLAMLSAYLQRTARLSPQLALPGI